MGGFRIPVGPILLVLVIGGDFASVAQGDVVTLKSGGVLRGRVADSSIGTRRHNGIAARPISATFSLNTTTGGRLVLDSSLVAQITLRPLLLEEYEVRNRQTPDELASLWKLAEWCRSRGLRPQREEVLRRMVAIDPDHAAARQALGQTKRDGKWKTYDEEMRDRGFVKYEGKWIAQQEVQILKKMHAKKRVAQDWAERVHTWTRMLGSADPDRHRRGRAQLLNLSDNNAIPALNRYLRTSDDEESRELYVKILSRPPGDEATPFLVQQALLDSSKSVRIVAQEAISSERRQTAAPLVAHELRNPSNDVVRRAAVILEQFGDDRVVPQLIDALVTTHGVPTQVVERAGDTYSFTPNGGGGFGTPGAIPLPPDVYGKLVTGQYPNGVQVLPQSGPTAPQVRTVLVDRQFRNTEVLSALESLTKQSFGYDKRAWSRWWAAHTTTGIVHKGTTNSP